MCFFLVLSYLISSFSYSPFSSLFLLALEPPLVDDFSWGIDAQPHLYRHLSERLRADGFIGKVPDYLALLTAFGKVDVLYDRFLCSF